MGWRRSPLCVLDATSSAGKPEDKIDRVCMPTYGGDIERTSSMGRRSEIDRSLQRPTWAAHGDLISRSSAALPAGHLESCHRPSWLTVRTSPDFSFFNRGIGQTAQTIRTVGPFGSGRPAVLLPPARLDKPVALNSEMQRLTMRMRMRMRAYGRWTDSINAKTV